MKVSVIIPVYNGELTISRAINSCLNQNYTQIEILVIDNCSNDRTKEIVLNYKDPRVYYFYTDVQGRSNARNIGIEKSTGQFIVFLDADDELCSKKIDKGIKFLSENDEYIGHVTAVKYLNEKEKKEKIVIPYLKDSTELVYGNCFPINSIIFRKKLVFFDLNYEYNEDWLFFSELLLNEKIFFETDYIGGIVHIHDKNTMSNTDVMVLNEIIILRKIQKNYGIDNFDIKTKRLKLILILMYLNPDKSIIKKIKTTERKYYFFSVLMMKIPVLNKKITQKIKVQLEKNMY